MQSLAKTDYSGKEGGEEGGNKTPPYHCIEVADDYH